jgi:hypothetical protein
MRKDRLFPMLKALAVGAVLLQAGGCSFQVLNEIVQTVLLGVTAAGAVAILRNI